MFYSWRKLATIESANCEIISKTIEGKFYPYSRAVLAGWSQAPIQAVLLRGRMADVSYILLYCRSFVMVKSELVFQGFQIPAPPIMVRPLRTTYLLRLIENYSEKTSPCIIINSRFFFLYVSRKRHLFGIHFMKQ